MRTRLVMAALLVAVPLLMALPAAAAAPTDTPACPAGATCDDFETQTGSTPGGDWQVESPDCSGTGTATVDTTQANSGTHSIRIDGTGGYCNHVFVGRDIPATATYFRFYMRHSTAQPANHTAMVAMNDADANDTDLRFGGQNGALQWNRESDDATLPEQSPVGVSQSMPLPTDRWVCVEYEVAAGHIDTWVDGTEVAGLVEDGVPTADIDSQWVNSKPGWSPSLTDLRLGWESYADDADTLWYDDVAYGPSRIGC